MMSEITKVWLKIIGQGGHGSDPALSNNPIIPACTIYQEYNALIEKFKADGKLVNSTLPMFHAGEAVNVVPDTCLLRGTFRSLGEGLMEEFMKIFEEKVQEICGARKC